MRNAVIVGTGSYVPPRVVTNGELVGSMGIDVDERWIRTRTGVEARRFADEGVGTADLGARAARLALDAAGLKARELDQIVLCTLSPEHAFPGSGVYLQAALGIPDDDATFVPCFDIRAQCTGFLYGLSHAVAAVRSGMADRVLVVGSEVHSAALDLTTRGKTIASIFGDGAGAVVVAASDADRGVRRIELHADGRFADMLSQKVWDIRKRPFIATDADGNGIVPPQDLFATMNGPLVFKHAVHRMAEVLESVCDKEQTTVGAIDLFLFHQANLRIVRSVQHLLGIDDAKVLNNIERYGNTTAATLPLLLDEAVREGRLLPGMRVAMVAFGSGFTWGAAVLDW